MYCLITEYRDVVAHNISLEAAAALCSTDAHEIRSSINFGYGFRQIGELFLVEQTRQYRGEK